MVPNCNYLKMLVKILSKISIVHYVQGFCSRFPLPTAYTYVGSPLLLGARIDMPFRAISLRMFYVRKRFAVQTFFGNERIDQTPIHQKINHTIPKNSVKIYFFSKRLFKLFLYEFSDYSGKKFKDLRHIQSFQK